VGEGEASKGVPSEAEALLAVAKEIRALRKALDGSAGGDFIDTMYRAAGVDPKAQRERGRLAEAARSNQWAKYAVIIAGVTALASLVASVATLIAVT
jgi:hypothetical protein